MPVSPTVNPTTTNKTHPFTTAALQQSTGTALQQATIFRVRTISNGAGVDTDFDFTVDRAAPVTQVG